jgi:hypothetical protein
MGPPGSSAELFTVVTELVNPRLLAAELVRAAVQVAAVHAGIPPSVATGRTRPRDRVVSGPSSHPPPMCPAAPHVLQRRRSGQDKGGEPTCRPGSVHPLARGGGHPSGTAVADSLVRPTREHRAGRPQSLAQGNCVSPPGLAPGGVYRAAAVTCGAGGLLHHRFTLTPRQTRGGLFSVALSRGSPRVGVTDHPALWSPDLPHRASARRDRPADSPTAQDTPRTTSHHGPMDRIVLGQHDRGGVRPVFEQPSLLPQEHVEIAAT